MQDNFYAMGEIKQKPITPHTLSSNVRQPGGSISVFPRKKAPKLKMDRYLQGRSYQLFKRGVKAARTLEGYNRNLYLFCDFIGMTTEQIVEKHGPFIKVKGANRPNVEGLFELQKRVEDFVLMLQDRVDAGEIKATTCMPKLSPIRLFCEMNDITLNFRKIFRLLPKSDLVASDAAYTLDQIRSMLQFCDLRARIIILFFGSSGMRLGGLVGLKDGDVKPVFSAEDPNQVIAVHLVVYRGTEDEYDTFASPEAWAAYSEYRDLRLKCGEPLTADSPFILSRFSPKSLKAGKAKAIYHGTITNIVSAVCYKAGITQKSKYYKDRFNVKRIHGLRKFFLTSLKSVKTSEGQPAIDFVNRERLMGHALIHHHALEDNYDRADQVRVLLDSYLKAVSVLTISDESRLALKVTKLEEDVKTYKTVEVEVAEKDRQIRELQGQMQAMQESQDEIKELLKHPEKILELLKENEESQG